jgi:hypothetical protein
MAWQYSLSQDASHKVWGLPLAEHPVWRHWRGVKGGTVLSLCFIILRESIAHHDEKEKLIVFIKMRKKSNG